MSLSTASRIAAFTRRNSREGGALSGRPHRPDLLLTGHDGAEQACVPSVAGANCSPP